MKTPNDLTDEEYEMLGFYTEDEVEKHSWANLADDNEPMFVNARITKDLYSSGLNLEIVIWDKNNIIGGNKFYFLPDNMHHVFDFYQKFALLEQFDSDPFMIEYLLEVLKYGELAS